MEEMQGSQCRYRYCDGLAYLRTGSIVHISAALFRHALDPPETSQFSTHPGSQWSATRSLDEFGIETQTCSKSSKPTSALSASFHIADVPGRHEPGTGEINFTAIYQKLADFTTTAGSPWSSTPSPTRATLRSARRQVEAAYTRVA